MDFEKQKPKPYFNLIFSSSIILKTFVICEYSKCLEHIILTIIRYLRRKDHQKRDNLNVV